jgi:hypothetical protein
LLANTVIETFDVRVEEPELAEADDAEADEEDEAEPADEAELAKQAG